MTELYGFFTFYEKTGTTTKAKQLRGGGSFSPWREKNKKLIRTNSLLLEIAGDGREVHQICKDNAELGWQSRRNEIIPRLVIPMCTVNVQSPKETWNFHGQHHGSIDSVGSVGLLADPWTCYEPLGKLLRMRCTPDADRLSLTGENHMNHAYQ